MAGNQSSTAKRRCQFRGKSGKRCNRQFVLRKHGTRRIHCAFHQALTARENARAVKKRAYDTNPEKFRKRARRYLPSTFKNTEPKKYREMQDAVNARQRAWRLKHPKKSAATSRRYRTNHPERVKKIQVDYHRRLHNAAAIGKIIEKLKSKPLPWRLMVPLLLQDRHLSNAELRDLTDTKQISTRLSEGAMNRLRKFCGVPGPKGRRRKKL